LIPKDMKRTGHTWDHVAQKFFSECKHAADNSVADTGN